jgi:hypothetical protein
MKRCNKCGETKPINLFSKDKYKRDGVQTYCTQCCVIDQARRRQLPRGRAIALMSDARHSSKKRKLKIDISNDWVEEKLKKGVCELTGIPFDFSPSKNTYLNKCAPSLDRINSNKGYTKDNVRVVLCAVNNALGQYSDEEILPILKVLVKAIEKNVKQNTTTPVSEGAYIQGAVGAELGSVSTPWTWENDNYTYDYSGAPRGENTYNSSKEGSGDSMGHGSEKVGSSQTFESVQDNGKPVTAAGLAGHGSGRIPDKP